MIFVGLQKSDDPYRNFFKHNIFPKAAFYFLKLHNHNLRVKQVNVDKNLIL